MVTITGKICYISNINMKKVLIIGGCGYIGSKLYSYLEEKGFDVLSVDLELFGNANIKNLKENFKNLTQEYLSQFSDIILLAGHSSVKMCESNLIGSFRNNVQYFIELLLKISENQKLIYASSSSVYGNINRNVVSEDCQEYSAGSFYDLSKSEIDQYIKIFNKINYYGLRFGTVNGASPNIRNDIMINAMYNSFHKNGYLNIANPMVKRPILDIKDLCRAIETIINNGVKEKRGIYNLASFNSNVETIGRKVAELTGAKLNFVDTIDSDSSAPKVYDFAISCEKFAKTFDFKFEGSIESITNDVKENFSKALIIDSRNVKDINI